MGKSKNIFISLAIIVYFIWTVIIFVFIYWIMQNQNNQIKLLSQQEAHDIVQKDIAFRKWASNLGGFFVPITEDTPPNPYLTNIEDKNIKTDTGRYLTLMNPAYALRQMMKSYETEFGVRSRITSLNPLNPINIPDEWEKKALEKIEKNRSDVTEFTQVGEQNYVRLMSPIITEESCLKCHSHQGYTVGDVRGGVTVAVLIDEYIDMADVVIHEATINMIIIWLIGMVFISICLIYIWKHLMFKHNEKQLIIENDEHKAVLLKEIHHRIKNNLQTITSLINLQIANEPDNQKYIDAMNETLLRIDSIASIHKDLYGQADLEFVPMNKYIQEIYREISCTFDVDEADVNLILKCEVTSLKTDYAVPVGLVLTELLTNIFKYAFPEKKGIIKISFQQHPDQSYLLMISDNGIGLPLDMNPDNIDSMGIVLVKSLVKQINGSFTLDGSNGCEYVIQFS